MKATGRLDLVRFTDFDAAVRLLRTAPWHTEYVLKLPPDWRDLAEVAEAANVRIEAAGAVGLKVLVERYLYRWVPD